ncbi:UDP-glucose/GDP-mannose dehydrogenase family protein [Candidatus Gottesmanbacteria bacterium]|nr:UDP-glucose/GDP-mannose dehydrogenase family protein [Candidatus Gottesmanbacteria bacterium]
MIISVIGHGYVGLVTAAVFADLGNTVFCVGRTKEKIENLKKGIIPFYEPGLAEVVKKNLAAGRLKFTLSYQEAIPPSEIIFICVGTPSLDNGEADLSQVFAAAETVGKNLKKEAIIVVKSTVPMGTVRKVAEIIEKVKPAETSFEIASVPEFLREGTALSDTLHPDRIVIGTDSPRAQKLLLKLHKPIDGEFVLTDISSAEMIKYAANALLAMKISFSNAIAFLCEKTGANVEKVLDGVGLDKRLGRSFLYPGVGYGGSCLPKDIKALISVFKKHKISAKLFEAVDEINQEATARFVDKVTEVLGQDLKGKTLGVLGLSFKPNTDDLRDAPSITIINALAACGAKIRAFDRVTMPRARQILKNVIYCKNSEEVGKGADALLIITEWNEFRQLNLAKIKKLLKKPIIFDGRNIYNPEKVKKLGFIYKGVGR